MNPKVPHLFRSCTDQLSRVCVDGDGRPTAVPCPIYVGRCELGAAVFAARGFAVGEHILSFKGPIISHAQARAKGIEEANPLQIGFDRYIDLEPPGVYVNHSCNPNAGIIQDRLLIALRAVKVGEELRFDYSTTMSDDGWMMECRCGARACRGAVRAFEHLHHELMQHYIDLGVVQRFLLEQPTFDKGQHV